MSKFLQKLYERQVVGKTVVIGKQSTPNFLKKKTFLTPLQFLDICFLENLVCFIFLLPLS